MNGFNLSEWALRHRSFVWYLMAAIVAAGALSYTRLGRQEDPSFTIKSMIVYASWPGATVEEMTNQVTDRIERKLQELGALDFTRSYTTSGQTTVYVNLKDDTPSREIRDIWIQVRNKVNDIRSDFPSNVQGPYFNDEFGDVFGNIYALTADGLSFRQLRDYAEQARAQILKLPSAGKVELLGVQDEVVHLNFSTRHIAGLGIDQQAVLTSLQQQNAVAPSGIVQAGPETVTLRVSGQFRSVEALRAVNIRVNDRFFRLADVATITRGYVDPPQPMFRFNGQPAIGIAIGMKENSNLIQFGKDLRAHMTRVVADLPIGVGVHLVSNQPAVVDEAIGGFTRALFEAIAIVLVVSFVSLGLRAGLVVAIAIPLVLAATFVFMEYSGIILQRISLGALIIALGLLVDDAMISVEMMVARREAGDSLERSATFAYSSTAFPMLTGTLVTVAGFVPIGLNGSSAGEYTFTLFAVIAAALLISWVVAVLFTPLLGVTMLPGTVNSEKEGPSRLKVRFQPLVLLALRRRWFTIALALGLFALSVVGLGSVQNQFFPAADRPELLVDMTLLQSSSIAETKTEMDRLEKTLAGDADIVRWSSYVGQGAVRFYLPLDEQLANPFFGQVVIVARDFDARQRVAARLRKLLREEFVGIDGFVHPLELGPPVGRPIQYRLSGPDIQTVRGLALKLAEIVGANAHVGGIVYDWNEPSLALRIDVDQNRARQLGVSSQDIATVLNNVVGGSAITQMYDSIYIINIVARADRAERVSIAVGPLSAWASALGGLGSVLGDTNASTLTYNFGGTAAGLDYRFDPRFLAGIGVGYTHGTQWVNSFMGQGWSDSVSVAAYGSFTQSNFYLDALAGYAYYGNQLQRQILIPGLQQRTATGSTGANQFLGQVEGGYKVDVYAPAAASITPFGRFQISSVTQNAFSESGAQSLNLNVAQQTTNSQRTTIGADLGSSIGLGNERKLDLAVRLGWMHEFADVARPITAALAGAAGNSFTVFGATPLRNAAVVGLQATTTIAAATQVYLRYDGEIATGTDNHALNIGLRMSW